MTDLRTAPPGAGAVVDDLVTGRPEPSGAPSRPPARRPRVDHDVLAVAGQGLTIFGVLVLAFGAYLVGLSSLEQGRDQRGMLRRFRPALAFGQAPLGGRIAEGSPVAVLEVPRVGLRQVVVEGTSSRQLKKGPGHLRTTPLPGQRGNVVVAGRRLAYNGPFRKLGQLRRGDRITTTTGQGRATYVVTGLARLPSRRGELLGRTGDNRLTLITSTPLLLASDRLVATAALRTEPRPAPAGRPVELREDELGLQGETGAGPPLLLWAEVLLLVGVGTAWLYRRRPRWTTWLLTTPVLLLLVLLVFDSFTALLPATL